MALGVAALTGCAIVERLRLADNVFVEPAKPHFVKLRNDLVGAQQVTYTGKVGGALVVVQREGLEDPVAAARSELEEALLRLRLYRIGQIGFNFGIYDSSHWYETGKLDPGTTIPSFSVHHYLVWQHPRLGMYLIVGKNDENGLAAIFTAAGAQQLLQKTAYRNFFRSYHEPYATDRFLQCAMALESLLVNDSRDTSNITYKFVDRGAFLMHQARPVDGGVGEYVLRLKRIYGARSKLVHGSGPTGGDWTRPDEVALLEDADEFARVGLRYVLDHPDLADSCRLDDAKRARY